VKRPPNDRNPALGATLERGSRFSLASLALLLALPACAASPPPVPPRPLAPPPPAVTAAPLPPALPALPEAAPLEDPEALGDDEHDDGEGIDDDDTADASAPAPSSAAALSPLLQLTDAEITARFKKDPVSFGPLSVGRPNAGALVNGVKMPADPAKWIVLEPGLAWGTQETIDGISKAIERVHADFGTSQPIPIGHISSKAGGYLPVHKSHQAGRDVDIGYYFTTPKSHFFTGTKANLDLARSLALVKAFFAVSDVEMILIDTSIQKLLVEYALSHGEDVAWLDKTFQSRQKPGYAPVRHVRGHKNHIHVRFASPQAVALGRRVSSLVAIHAAPPPGSKAAKAVAAAAVTAPQDKLVAHLAKRYGCTMEAIQRVNGLKGVALKAGHVYQIPVPPAPKYGAPLPAAQKHPAPAAKQAPAPAPKKGKTGG
jgi:murein endopeptidase